MQTINGEKGKCGTEPQTHTFTLSKLHMFVLVSCPSRTMSKKLSENHFLIPTFCREDLGWICFMGLANFRKIAGEFLSESRWRMLIAKISALFSGSPKKITPKIHAQTCWHSSPISLPQTQTVFTPIFCLRVRPPFLRSFHARVYWGWRDKAQVVWGEPRLRRRKRAEGRSGGTSLPAFSERRAGGGARRRLQLLSSLSSATLTTVLKHYNDKNKQCAN